MRSLCQAEWETSSQEEESARQMVEEKEASEMGDGGGEEKAEGETDQEGDTEDGGGGGRGAASPSLPTPTPVDSYFSPKEPGELTVWAPKPYAKQIAFMTSLLLDRVAHFERQNLPDDPFYVIEPYWVRNILKRIKERFEDTPKQKQKMAEDKEQWWINATARIHRRNGRFTAWLDHNCGIPREDGGDASGAPPTRKKSSQNKGGYKIAQFVLATGCYDNDSLQIYLKCLEEGAARRRMEDEK